VEAKLKWRFVGILIAVCVFDAVFQVVQDIVANVAQQTALTGVGIADFVWLIANHAHASYEIIKGIVLAALMAYLWSLRWLYRRNGVVDAH